MKILIRCDMGGIYGHGHAVRMYALAQELSRRGHQSAFISNTPDALRPFVAPFSCTHAATLALEPASHDYGSVDVIIVDTKYPIDEPWYAGIREALRGKIVRIDHPQATPESCDLLVAPGAHWDRETVRQCSQQFGTGFLYGWDYVLLSPAVVEQPPVPYSQRKRGVLVLCAGGSDPAGMLDLMMEWTVGLEVPAPLHFLRPGTLMTTYAQALRHASLVVGMFGQTAYECLWYQTPMLLFGHTAENVEGARWLQEASEEHVTWGGNLLATGRQAFCALVRDTYYANIGRLTGFGRQWMDGRGVERVAEAILGV